MPNHTPIPGSKAPATGLHKYRLCDKQLWCASLKLPKKESPRNTAPTGVPKLSTCILHPGEGPSVDPLSPEEKLWHRCRLAINPVCPDPSPVTAVPARQHPLTRALHRCSTTKRMVVPSKEGGATIRGPVAGAVMLMTGLASAAPCRGGGGPLLVAT